MKFNLRPVLPKMLHAVPGHELSIYFDNIVLAPNIHNFLFDVTCEHGRQDHDRWRYVPATDEVASFPLSIELIHTD